MRGGRNARSFFCFRDPYCSASHSALRRGGRRAHSLMGSMSTATAARATGPQRRHQSGLSPVASSSSPSASAYQPVPQHVLDQRLMAFRHDMNRVIAVMEQREAAFEQALLAGNSHHIRPLTTAPLPHAETLQRDQQPTHSRPTASSSSSWASVSIANGGVGGAKAAQHSGRPAGAAVRRRPVADRLSPMALLEAVSAAGGRGSYNDATNPFTGTRSQRAARRALCAVPASMNRFLSPMRTGGGKKNVAPPSSSSGAADSDSSGSVDVATASESDDAADESSIGVSGIDDEGGNVMEEALAGKSLPSSRMTSGASTTPAAAAAPSLSHDPFVYDPHLVKFLHSQLTNSILGANSSVRVEIEKGVARARAAAAAAATEGGGEGGGPSNPPPLSFSGGGLDRRVDNRNKSSQPEGQSMWESRIPWSEKMDTFECNNKQVWVDMASGWCHLCDEPVGGGYGLHIGDRDHMCLQLFLTLFARYPERQVGPDCKSLQERSAKVLAAAAKHPQLQSIYRYAARPHSQDHLHTHQEAVRRAELTAILIHLCQPPHRAITHVMQGRSEWAFWHSGERMFRGQFTRAIAQTFPPMAAGMVTQFTHKCYGRTNLERCYDALNIAHIQRMFGGTAQEDKDSKAQFMRLLMWNLLDTAVKSPSVIEGTNAVNPHMEAYRQGVKRGGATSEEEGSAVETVGGVRPLLASTIAAVSSSSSSSSATSPPSTAAQRASTLSALRDDMLQFVDTSDPHGSPTSAHHHELTMELVRLARRRLVFELIFLQSMQFMNKVQGAVKRFGHLTYEELLLMNAC